MKTKYLFGAIAFSLAFASCSEDMMDRINRDEAHPGINLNARLQLTETEVSTVYSTLCGNYAWYVSSFTEQLFGTGNNQLRQVEARNTSEVAGSPVFENEWNSTYLNLHNLSLLRNKCQEGGVNAGEYALLGMAQTLEALNWATLTDLHGDIPYKECFVKSAPKIDKQKEVYARVFELLDSAQINLARGTDDVSDNDILYKGKTDQWLAFVHALKARYLLRTYGTNKTNAQLQKVITEAQAALDGGFTGCELANPSITTTNGATTLWQIPEMTRWPPKRSMSIGLPIWKMVPHLCMCSAFPSSTLSLPKPRYAWDLTPRQTSNQGSKHLSKTSIRLAEASSTRQYPTAKSLPISRQSAHVTPQTH